MLPQHSHSEVSMKHMQEAIEATIDSIEKSVKRGQYNIRANAVELLTLHKLKEIYKTQEIKDANPKRRKAPNTTSK